MSWAGITIPGVAGVSSSPRGELGRLLVSSSAVRFVITAFEPFDARRPRSSSTGGFCPSSLPSCPPLSPRCWTRSPTR
jgi:hypothetical protein